MITDTFDNLSPAIINPAQKDGAPEADACIVTFSHEIEKHAAEHYAAGELASLWCATGRTPVYLIERNGKRFAFYKTYVGAPITTGLMEDAAAEIKCRKFILFGGAGCLNRDARKGDGSDGGLQGRGDFLSLRACRGLRHGEERAGCGGMHESQRDSLCAWENLDDGFLLPGDKKQF